MLPTKHRFCTYRTAAISVYPSQTKEKIKKKIITAFFFIENDSTGAIPIIIIIYRFPLPQFFRIEFHNLKWCPPSVESRRRRAFVLCSLN
jgi:hypothetical protein